MEPSSNEERFEYAKSTVNIGQRFLLFVTKPFLLFFLHFKVYGKENLEGLEKGIIFASNHACDFDGEFIFEALGLFSKRIPLYYVSREESFYKKDLFQVIFYTSFVLRRFAGAYPALFGVRDYEKSLAFHINLLKEKRNVVIFIEGSKSQDGNLLPAKGGVIALSKQSKAPIVPVIIHGSLKITLKDFLLRRRHVSVTFGKPIFYNELFIEYDAKDPRQYAKIADKKIMTKIAELFQKRI
jgi:1-acyl-sn-glycerol-3-phosphate acyltransferase